ncbi:hypothetical protein PY650_26675 [Rhizobium calliandrae]|uniref:Uncharacterized protein n=1 Tax=Rhizobium calliandrae TaxID=1312182 RepID=A0ABT7KLY0_9HYPH|nr:hypothetical protein [Rhizobium calliandrae]MDL2409157.1 hypothetical protein [Rhizobium calliandrae]
MPPSESDSATSQEQQRFPFAITAVAPDGSGNWDYDCRITIFDGRNRIQGGGNGRVNLDLRKGLYVVRLVSAGSMTEKVIVHEGPTDLDIKGPVRSSALPASDTRDHHEYYIGPARQFSRESTTDAPPSSAGSCRLMIMFRTRDMEENGAFAGVDLGSLQTPDGDVVTSFQDEDLARDPGAGWAIFSACLKPGPYLLINEENADQIVMPIHLFSGWDNLMFVPVDMTRGGGREEKSPRVNLSRASLDMVAHDRGFEPDDGFSQKIDASVQVLGKRFGAIPENIRTAAINGKFDHPLAGLIGACAHFLRDEPDPNLEAAMLRNLWSLMPGSPDVIGLFFLSLRRKDSQRPTDLAALLAAAEAAFGKSIAALLPLATPPMLRPTLDAIIALSQELPDLIAARSWLETASISDYAAGPWGVFDGSPMVSLVVSAQRSVQAPLSHQKLYPIVKSVFSLTLDLARRADWAISKDATIKSIAESPLALELGRTQLGAKLQELQVQFFPDLIGANDTVSDVVSKIRDQSDNIMHIGVSSSLPQWLLDMAQDVVAQEDIDSMARDLARRAQVPIRVAASALQLAKGSKSTSDGTAPTLEAGA